MAEDLTSGRGSSNAPEVREPQLTAVPGGPAGARRDPASVKAARFGDLAGDSPAAGNETIHFLMDVGLLVNVELGRAEMALKDVLKLSPGSVIELKRAASEPVDVFVNNRVVARGEVVVVDDRFGVRITEMVA